MATPRDVSLQMTRNIGIMAHIDAGKTDIQTFATSPMMAIPG